MNYLVVDSSRKKLEVCASIDGKIQNHTDATPIQSSITLMPTIQKLMGDSKINDLEYMGICVGPGSFTGIRIGVTTAKIFGYLSNIKLIPFNTLELYAYNIYDSSLAHIESIIALSSSGNANVYGAVFELGQDGLFNTLLEPVVMTPDQTTIFLESVDEPTVVVTDFEIMCSNPNIKVLQADSCTQAMHRIMATAERRKTCNYAQLEPLYIQVPQAERG